MKTFNSTSQLIGLLRDERGLEIGNEEAAFDFLRSTNYYRFTGYSRYFQVNPAVGDNRYQPGATFEQIAELIQRDDELRIRLFVPLSEVELAVRARFAHLAGSRFGTEAFYLRPENYVADTRATPKRIRGLHRELMATSSRMVMHYRGIGKDVERVPIWVAVEVLSFGKLSWMIASLKAEVLRDELADFFGYSRATFPRVLHALSALRNVCAHHGQLWHRNLTIQCPLPMNKRERPRDLKFHAQSLYPAVLALKKLAKKEASCTQIEIIESSLRDKCAYSTGLLMPQGVR